MDEKRFIPPQELLIDSYRLAKLVFDSGYRPTFLIALWRGGTPIGIAIQEFLQYKSLKTDHIAVRTSRYQGSQGSERIEVYGLGYPARQANAEDRLLLVDDVFDEGLSSEAVSSNLRALA